MSRPLPASAQSDPMRPSLGIAIAVLIGAILTAAIVLPIVAFAHHTTVTCQTPGEWLIVNSESQTAMTFTTSAGHSGSIPAGGSTTVSYSGGSLTVYGRWANGVTHTDTGRGNCTTTSTTTPTTSTSTTVAETTTTTEAPPSTTTSSTSTPSSTLPGSTSTSTLPPTSTSSAPPTSTPALPSTSSSTTIPATGPSTTSSTPPSTPSTTLPAPSMPPSTGCETFDPADPDAGRCWQLAVTR